MSFSECQQRFAETAHEVEVLSNHERGHLDRAWREAFSQPSRNSRGQLTTRWVEKNALELYRAEHAKEFMVLPMDWKDPAFRCRADSLPEFGFDGVFVAPTDLSWGMLFMACDLEGGPYFTRREWHKNEPA